MVEYAKEQKPENLFSVLYDNSLTIIKKELSKVFFSLNPIKIADRKRFRITKN